MREIVLDTETTGLDPQDGHRLLEIGCVELHNHLPTGENLHLYINPERDVPAEAVAVHGLTTQFLSSKPVFSEVFTVFLDFIEGASLVIHNAAFDLKFLNHELKAVGHPGLGRFKVIDTLLMARKKFPGSPANLDALCRRFAIDNTARTLHGALLDSEILAEVYLELLGGRQHGLTLAPEKEGPAGMGAGAGQGADNAQPGAPGSCAEMYRNKPFRTPRRFAPTEEEAARHAALLERLKDPLWKEKSV